MDNATETRWLDPREQAAWRAYIMGTELLLHRLDRELRESNGISLSEYEILVRLSESPQHSMRMAILADSVSHSRSRITHTVARMERAGLVTRQQCDADGRGIEAVMTAAGRAVLEAAAPHHVEAVRANLIDLATCEDFEALGRIFNDVSDRLLAGKPKDVDIRPKDVDIR